MKEEQETNKFQTPNTGGRAGRFVPGVSLKRYPFIFDWHQGRVLPTPACGITPNTQKSERYTDAVDLGGGGGPGNLSEGKNSDSERKSDNGDDYQCQNRVVKTSNTRKNFRYDIILCFG